VEVLPSTHIFQRGDNKDFLSLNQHLTTFGYPLPTRSLNNEIEIFHIRALSGNLVSSILGKWPIPDVTLHPLYDLSIPSLHGLSGAPVFSDDFKLRGLWLGSSEAYVVEKTLTEKQETHTIEIQMGWRFGICLNLRGFEELEPRILTFI
jgi:hypothetical protein